MTQFLQQNQTMKQTHILTHKNQQALKILKMDSRELLELISECVQQNPFLDFHPSAQGDDYLLQNAIQRPSLQEDLYMQLHTLREPYDEAICAYLIESLDEHGFLSGSVSAYCEDLQIDEETLLSQLRILQGFEPCGVAARSIREALILQCRKTRNTMGEQILSEYAQELVEGDLAAIAGGMQLSVREVKEVIASLRTCNPDPCAAYAKEHVETILPEVEICVQDQQLQIVPMRYGATLVQEQYVQAIEQNEQLKAYFREANLLFETLNRRNATLLLIMNELVSIQKHHFLFGDELQSCTLQHLADQLGLHVSTVSRALQHKYYLFHGECYPIRSLLCTATAQGDSSDAVQRAITEILRHEDPSHPFSDQQLVIKLRTMDISVSRRTVTKYRKLLHIPSSTHRKHT